MTSAKHFLHFFYKLSPRQSQKKDSKWLPLTAGLICMVYLSYVLSSLAFLPDAEADSNYKMAEYPLVNVQLEPSPDFLLISEWHLFGQAAENVAAASNISETQLNLRLLGVFWLNQSVENVYAIIQAEDGVQKKYQPGDELPGGVSVQAIRTSQVVLLHNNRQETLSLEKNNAGLLSAAD
ncbi:hypothetical protein A1359_20030 [Methylomonas lenta]|uniref:Type II secretion system protein GspC N-terminal domain-containing protein n=2 Tax=Methylomonas lenta TaxID=980561 RepID=A0A177NS72_9GAMM|nr:type II secretion system protein N [Methylomonas lenta]OAI20948.1 hypothetical protein A1359_20030 [Methylomonas lenta]